MYTTRKVRVLAKITLHLKQKVYDKEFKMVNNIRFRYFYCCNIICKH